MRLGLYGFIVSMLVCGAVLAVGLAGLIAPMTVFVIFVLGRAIYGAWGSASPPAVQAYVAARTEGDQRTNALAAIASSFGLGTIIGPAIAPLFIFPPLGCPGPLIVFAAIGLSVLAAVVLRLPDDTPRSSPRGQIVAYPGDRRSRSAPLRARARAMSLRTCAGAIRGCCPGTSSESSAATARPRCSESSASSSSTGSSLPLAEAQQWIAIVLMAGAGASLLAQWGLIPCLGLDPAPARLSGARSLAAAGAVAGRARRRAYGTTMGFALASLGFGLFRPGFTSGASLAVRPGEQNTVAGMVTSVNGVAYIAGPAIGVLLYGRGGRCPSSRSAP